jgi:addiction module RelE/StbE family toxin
MVKKHYRVVWTKRSQKHLDNAYKYINKDSPQNAKKVIEEIIKATERAIDNPEFFAADKYKANNDGSYRAFEKHHYRIAYRFTKNIIRILRVRHTKMEPKVY